MNSFSNDHPCKGWFFKEKEHLKLLFRSIPGIVLTMVIVSIIMMNFLANKIVFSIDWIAIDGGIFISWLLFLSLDVVTKYFGPRAANRVVLLSSLIYLFVALVFLGVSKIPTPGRDQSAVNSILGGEWFILLSSITAFIISGLLNTALNCIVGNLFKKNPNSGLSFFTRTYVSTVVAQFVDNLIFAVLCYMLFAPIFWGDAYKLTIVQCLASAGIGAILELLFEVVFSPLGLIVVRKWEKEELAKPYFEFLRENYR